MATFASYPPGKFVDSVTDDLAKSLRCMKCSCYFDVNIRKPRRLRCEHIVCQVCAVSIIREQSIITCGRCGVQTQVYGVDISQLPVPQHTMDLLNFLTPESGQLETANIPAMLNKLRMVALFPGDQTPMPGGYMGGGFWSYYYSLYPSAVGAGPSQQAPRQAAWSLTTSQQVLPMLPAATQQTCQLYPAAGVAPQAASSSLPTYTGSSLQPASAAVGPAGASSHPVAQQTSQVYPAAVVAPQAASSSLPSYTGNSLHPSSAVGPAGAGHQHAPHQSLGGHYSTYPDWYQTVGAAQQASQHHAQQGVAVAGASTSGLANDGSVMSSHSQYYGPAPKTQDHPSGGSASKQRKMS